MLVLADYADGIDSHAYPSVKTLSKVTELNRKTVMQALVSLRESGLIQDTGERIGHTKSVPVYHVGSSPKNGTAKQSHFFPQAVPVLDTSGPKNGTTTHNICIEPSGNRKGTGEQPSYAKFTNVLKTQLKDVESEIQRLKDFGRTEEEKQDLRDLIARRKQLKREYFYS